MNYKEIQDLGLFPKTLGNIDIDHVAVISNDEFNRPEPSFRPHFQLDYRNRAINRLVENKLPFWINCNLTWDIVKRYVNITCPYCGNPMKYSQGSGNSDTSSVEFKCFKCKSTAYLSLSNDKGLSFNPKE